jgi:DNA invertase Pin-like site-specific DNA recombinase
MDDQLVLGIKGTLSVVELKVLKNRLLRGQEEKARRGELFRNVAPGYRREGDDRIVKDPDLRVQTRSNWCLQNSGKAGARGRRTSGSSPNQVTLPVNRYSNGKVTIEWQLPGVDVYWIDNEEPDIRRRLCIRDGSRRRWW